MDGHVIIGTKLDNKQLEKDLKKAESELRRYSNEAERLTDKKAKAEIDLQPYEEAKRLIKEATDGALQYAQTEHEVNSALNIEKGQLENLNEKYSKQLGHLQEIKQKISDNAIAQNATKAKIESINNQLGRTSFNLNSIKGMTDVVNKSMSNVVRKIAHWGVALIGIRGMYGFIRNSVSTLSQYNKTLAADVSYISYALATTLQPVIERIIQLIYKLLSYINYIAKAWFGVNLFANASAKAFQNANQSAGGISKNLGKATKQAKELNKQLAGFDEMNVLQDNASADTGSGGGAGGGGVGGAALPSFDLSGLDGEVPEWLKWIADHKDEIIAGLLGIAGALTALKMGASGLKALGIGLMIAGIVYAIEGLLAYLKDPTWENFGKIIQGIGVFIVGLGLVIGSLPVIIAGVIVLIVGTVIKYWDKIKAFLQKGIDWLKGGSKNIRKIFGDVIGNIYDFFVEKLQRALYWLDTIITTVRKVFDGVIKIVKGIMEGDWSKVWEGAKQIVSAVWDAIVATFKLMLDGILSTLKLILDTIVGIIKGIVKTIIDWINKYLITPIVNFFTNLWTTIKNGVNNVWNSVKSVISTVANWINTKIVQPIARFFTGLWNGIKSGVSGAVNTVKNLFSGVVNFFRNIVNTIVNVFGTIGSKVGNAIGGAFKGAINAVLRAVESILNTPIRAINGLIGAINSIPGVNFRKLSTLRLPRLAKGGIINQPGRGVMVGSAIAGERGAEGVIPLTDSQQMALLGEAIGKYININATVPVYVGNRQIAREIKQINAESDFAYNR